ncbi:MAG TPA: peptidylprolyl isomerase [Acidimicrobiia bacterium]|jgi:foldase protein PrsA
MSDDDAVPDADEATTDATDATDSTEAVDAETPDGATDATDATTDDEATDSASPAGAGLSGRKIAAMVVGVLLVAGFVVGLIASKHQKDDEGNKAGGPVATIDGVKISRTALDTEVNTWVANKAYVSAAKQQGETMVGTNGQPTLSFQRDILTQQIEDVLFTREFNRRHLKVTAAENSSLQQEVSGNAALQKYPKVFLTAIVSRAARVQALEDALTTPPTNAQIEAAYEAQYGCTSGKDVSHILVATLAEATTIKAQLDSGASFATLAKSKSTDTGSAPSGGALGCLKRNEFVKPFEDAAFAATVGTPTAPVKSQFGYHIILVTAHSNASTPSLASVRQQIVQTLEQTPTQFNNYVDSAFGKAKVTIDPAFGMWGKTSNGYQVIAATAAKPASKGSAAAASSAASGPLPVADERPHKR